MSLKQLSNANSNYYSKERELKKKRNYYWKKIKRRWNLKESLKSENRR